MSAGHALSQLRILRGSNVVQPFRVAALAHIVLKNPGRLGHELWTIYEQLAIALLDMGDIPQATTYIDKLQTKFHSCSSRVTKLRAMEAEAKGDFNTAMALYNQLIEQRESDLSVYKRKIGVLKSQGRIKDAISALNTLLDTVPGDPEGWLELAHLYLGENMLQQASFAVEEAILLIPTSHFVHQTYAQIQYALGNWELALKSYCRSVELIPTFVAGLYGIVQCTTALMTTSDANSTEDEIANWGILKNKALTMLSRIYEQTVVRGRDDSETLQAVRGFIDESRA